MNKNYALGLLHLMHLLVNADGIIDDNEKAAILKIKENENISDAVYTEFQQSLAARSERDIYHDGIEYINRCSAVEKLRTFVMLYKLSEVDGNVHLKEIRLLLYAIKMAEIEFDDVVSEAKKIALFF